MTTASRAPQTTSDGSIATHCSISIVSTLANPILATTSMSHFPLHPCSLTLQMTPNSSAITSSTHFSLTMLPHLKHPSIPSFPIYCLSTTRGRVENLPTPGIRQVNLELTAFPHSFDNTRNTRMLYCPHPTSILLGAKQPRTK